MEWPSLSVFSSSDTVREASFLLTSVIRYLSLLQGKSGGLVSPVIRPVTEKVELDKCLPVASKHLFTAIFGFVSELFLIFLIFFFLAKTNLSHQKRTKGTQWGSGMQFRILKNKFVLV